MPKEQRDLFFMNQPKILKQFEAQFQKLQKNKIAKNTPPNPPVVQQVSNYFSLSSHAQRWIYFITSITIIPFASM